MSTRYYTMVEPDEQGNDVRVILSEKQILKEYWDTWYKRMCQTSKKEFVDENYGPEECIQDWVLLYNAW